jgi:hypothetical protein
MIMKGWIKLTEMPNSPRRVCVRHIAVFGTVREDDAAGDGAGAIMEFDNRWISYFQETPEQIEAAIAADAHGTLAQSLCDLELIAEVQRRGLVVPGRDGALVSPAVSAGGGAQNKE